MCLLPLPCQTKGRMLRGPGGRGMCLDQGAAAAQTGQTLMYDCTEQKGARQCMHDKLKAARMSCCIDKRWVHQCLGSKLNRQKRNSARSSSSAAAGRFASI